MMFARTDTPTELRTPRGAAESAQQWVAAALARTMHDASKSLAQLGVAVGHKSGSVAEDWQAGRKHLPVYVLACETVPRAVRARLIAALMQRLETGATRVGVDAATSHLLATSGRVVAAVALAWSDRELDESERAALRPLIHELVEACGRWLREATP